MQVVEDTPRHFNPAVQSGIATGQPGTQIFASLLRYDENFEPQPYLAESWDVSEDGLTVTVTLVEGATFHDGEPITSEDVAFSIETVKEYHPFKPMFAPVDSVDTPDARTAIINLAEPHPAILLAMSSQLLSIIPKHVYGDGQDIASHPRNTENVVGSGPFRLTEFNRGQNYIMERYDGYFMGEDLPYLDRIVTRIIGDPSARAIAMENGEAQLASFEPNPRDITRMEANANLEVTSEGYAAIGPIVWLAFNTKRAPLDDKRVRQAIAYAVDRDFIINALLLGTATPSLNGIHPGSPFYNPDVNPYALDVDQANALLDEAGHPMEGGSRFALTIDYGSETTKALAEYLRPALKKIGIDVTVRSAPDFPTWAQRISTYDFDMTFDTVFNWGDPVIGVNRTYQSSNIKPGVIWSNTQQYENPEVDRIIEEAGTETDPDRRTELYYQLQEILNEDLPLYPLYAVPYHTITSTTVGNPPRGIWATCAPMDRVYLRS